MDTLTSLRPLANPLPEHSFGKLGVMVCLVAQFNFFSTEFDPRAWTMVALWKEYLERQLQVITLENEGGDNTNYPPPANVTFLDDLEVPFGPQGAQTLTPLEPHQPPGPPSLPGIPPGWPPAPSPAGARERVETGNTSRERLDYTRIPTFTACASAYSNDQPPQGER